VGAGVSEKTEDQDTGEEAVAVPRLNLQTPTLFNPWHRKWTP